MPTPTNYVIMRNPYGKYVWWPNIGAVEYTVKGKHKGVLIAELTTNNNTEMHALITAAKHLVRVVLKRK